MGTCPINVQPLDFKRGMALCGPLQSTPARPWGRPAEPLAHVYLARTPGPPTKPTVHCRAALYRWSCAAATPKKDVLARLEWPGQARDWPWDGSTAGQQRSSAAVGCHCPGTGQWRRRLQEAAVTGASGQTRAVIRSSRNSNGQGLSQLPASITITVAILSRFPSSPRPTTGASILLRPRPRLCPSGSRRPPRPATAC